MPRPESPTAKSAGARLWRRGIVAVTAAIAGFGLAALTGMAIAKSFTVEVLGNATVTNTAGVSKHEAIVANPHGVSLYTLTHDTIAHPGCTKANGCFAFWIPATVPSKSTKLTKPSGVKGTLRTFHRNGLFQLTLNNHPLYTFKFDKKKKGVATGEGIPSFGGVWHAVLAARTTGKTPNTTTTTTSTTTMTTPPYTYPSY
jgi:predicted lipoprotein with Yx(FWY)xxD motif